MACTGPAMFLTWKELISDADLQPQNGRNSSNGKDHSLRTEKNPARPWKSKVAKTVRTDK
jgi:hypothetical protein